MKLLLIHTCGAEAVLGLAERGQVVAEQRLPGRTAGGSAGAGAGRGAAEILVPTIRALFAQAGWTVGELAAVGVVTGPGSFTGVRAGLSAAKGVCEAGGVRMVAMSRLALVAEAGGAALALLDAGRGEYFGGVYRPGVEPVERWMTAEEARGQIEARTTACSSEARVVESLGGQGIELVREPGAEEMMRMALRRIQAGGWSDVALTDGLYLRRTDAELFAKPRAGQD